MMLCLSWYTNATRQRAAGVVLPKNVRSTSRAVSPGFSSVEAFKGLSRRASVFHRGLKHIVCIVNNMIQPPYISNSNPWNIIQPVWWCLHPSWSLLQHYCHGRGPPAHIFLLKENFIEIANICLFFYFLIFEKADCSIFAMLVGWSVGWSTSPLICSIYTGIKALY